MPAYKNQKTGEWYCIFRVTDWTGKRKLQGIFAQSTA